MQRRNFVFGLTLAVGALAGCDTMSSQMSTSLTKSLASGLGISEAQASAGVGTVLNYAQGKLSSTDFSALAKSVPAADSYMKAASEKLGSIKMPDMSSLNSSLGKLGMTSDQINKFVPAVTDYVGKVGGDSAKNLLLSALR
jgi:hypothetical protein